MNKTAGIIVIKNKQNPGQLNVQVEVHDEDEFYWGGYDVNEPNSGHRTWDKHFWEIVSDLRDEISS